MLILLCIQPVIYPYCHCTRCTGDNACAVSAAQTVGDRVGRNEKTKVVAKLQKRGGGPPAREAAISEDERRAMMAFYYKKQEEMKALAENDEDDFMHSAWANPKALKSQLLGTGNINWRPGARR